MPLRTGDRPRSAKASQGPTILEIILQRGQGATEWELRGRRVNRSLIHAIASWRLCAFALKLIAVFRLTASAGYSRSKLEFRSQRW